MKVGDLAVFNLPNWHHTCWFVRAQQIIEQNITSTLLYNSNKVYMRCDEFHGHLVESISPDDENIVYLPALQLYTAEFEDTHFIKL